MYYLWINLMYSLISENCHIKSVTAKDQARSHFLRTVYSTLISYFAWSITPTLPFCLLWALTRLLHVIAWLVETCLPLRACLTSAPFDSRFLWDSEKGMSIWRGNKLIIMCCVEGFLAKWKKSKWKTNSKVWLNHCCYSSFENCDSSDGKSENNRSTSWLAVTLLKLSFDKPWWNNLAGIQYN